MFMQQANPEIEDKLKKYKRGQSMGELKKVKFRKNTNADDRNGHRNDDEDEGSPKAKSIHIIMRQDEEEKGRKITD
jgi:hypothetical protein